MSLKAAGIGRLNRFDFHLYGYKVLNSYLIATNNPNLENELRKSSGHIPQR